MAPDDTWFTPERIRAVQRAARQMTQPHERSSVMSRTVYVEDYGIVDCYYLVYATKVDPCAECAEDHEDHEWLITGVLHVAHNAIPLHLAFPTRGYRDSAFEAIVALVRREQARAVVEEEEDD